MISDHRTASTVLCFLVFFVCVVSSARISEPPRGVTQLTKFDFDDVINEETEHEFWLVLFYTTSCPKCITALERIQEFAEMEDQPVRVAIVECERERGLCYRWNAKSYPAFYMVWKGKFVFRVIIPSDKLKSSGTFLPHVQASKFRGLVSWKPRPEPLSLIMKNEGHYGCALLDFRNWEEETSKKTDKPWLIWFSNTACPACTSFMENIWRPLVDDERMVHHLARFYMGEVNHMIAKELTGAFGLSSTAYPSVVRYDVRSNSVWTYPDFDPSTVTIKQLQEFALRTYTEVQSKPLPKPRRRNISSGPPEEPPPPQVLALLERLKREKEEKQRQAEEEEGQPQREEGQPHKDEL
mmetsp:Transcript_2663/g.6413  ORF Transcript_2663/g.6413 Transcript_2663/m.6413 type:complete len:353 (-) Transcript_2663:34-1092(-)